MYFLAFGWTLVFGSFCTWHCQHELLFTLSSLQSALGLEDQCTESHAPLRPLGLAWNSSDCFESFSPLNNDVTEGVVTTRGNRMKFSLPLGPVVFKSIRFRSHRKRIDKRSNILRSIGIHTTCTVSMQNDRISHPQSSCGRGWHIPVLTHLIEYIKNASFTQSL